MRLIVFHASSDVVFDLILGYALFAQDNVLLGLFVLFLVLSSLIVSQVSPS